MSGLLRRAGLSAAFLALAAVFPAVADVRVSVGFGSGNLHPGYDFTETVASGTVYTRYVPDAGQKSVTNRVRVVALDGGDEVASGDFVFAVGKTNAFSVAASGLTPGAAYRTEVGLVSDGDIFDVYASAMGVMARELASGSSESNAGYRVTARFRADAVGFALTEANGVFGLRVVADEEDLPSFQCLDNRVWVSVPRSVAAPSLGAECRLDAFVRKDAGRLSYVLTDSAGGACDLMSVGLAEDLRGDFTRVDASGSGALAGEPECRLHSTEILRMGIEFSDETMAAGTNFTSSAVSGTLTLDQLWQTVYTNGLIDIAVRDKYGAIVGRRRISFSGLADDQPFRYYLDGLLQPGEHYSASVSAKVEGLGSVLRAADGLMARVVTNGTWAVEDKWIYEDVETFTGRAKARATGRWEYAAGLAGEDAEAGSISIHTMSSEGVASRVGFVATNELPFHTGFEMHSVLTFDTSWLALPEDVAGDYGITVIEPPNEGLKFAILYTNRWTVIPPSVCRPRVGVEYDVFIRADDTTGTVSYQVRSALDEETVLLAEYPLAETPCDVPTLTDFYGVGHVRTHAGDGYDISLVEVTTEIDGESTLTPGTNFAETVVRGFIRARQSWLLTDRTHGDVSVIFRDVSGNVVASNAVSYQELVDQSFEVPIGGLAAGSVYDVEIVTRLVDDEVFRAEVPAVMGRDLGAWIREDAETFAGEAPGTGLWSGTNGCAFVEASASGDVIRFAGAGSAAPVTFDPTNDLASLRYGSVQEFRAALNFGEPGWYGSGPAPEVRPGTFAGATVWCDDSAGQLTDDACALAVVCSTNGDWQVLDATRGAYGASSNCTVHVFVDYRTGFVRYYAENSSATNLLFQYDFEPTAVATPTFAFSGSGTLRSLDGDAWDPNLIASGADEFADLNAAIAGTDPATDVLSPLWWANQYVTLRRGEFRVSDPDHWLSVTFPTWYYVVSNEVGGVTVYRFNASNNWIDYAENTSNDVVTNGSVYLVKTAEGLSWIAARATNEWISGQIRLDADIDLTAHNWTPIAGFSGTFDGAGRTVTGLNNTNIVVEFPGGTYIGGPTNGWGRSTYGLFGTATNATLSDVTFAGVAISNFADSVATLVGALAGNCTVSNVTVESGSILGCGGTAAGVAGFADFGDFLRVINCANGAAVATENRLYGEGRWTAGIVCVGGPTNALASLGRVVVTNNANFGTLSGTLYDADLAGGNVAQILAGATLGARFGEVHLTNNLAAGAADVRLFPLTGDAESGDALAITNPPAVNLAAAYRGFDANGTYLRALDANVPGAVAVDPLLRTARMLSGSFQNGAENVAGAINDEITTRLPGTVLTLGEGFDNWGQVNLDRNITLDLGGNTVFSIYVQEPIRVGSGVHAKVMNGEIVVGRGETDEDFILPFVGDLTNLDTNDNLTVTYTDENFYERTALVVDGCYTSVFDLQGQVGLLNRIGTVIQLYKGSDVSLDLDAGILSVKGVTFAKLSQAYSFRAVTDDDGQVIGYRVRLADTVEGMPTMQISMPKGTDTEIGVTVGNTHAGITYTLQKSTSLDGRNWTDVPGQSVDVTTDGQPVNLSAEKSGEAGYFRILATETESSDP